MSNGLVQRPREGALATDNWTTMRDQAKTLVASGFLPATIKTAEQAIAVMITGQELGIPKMQALRQIVVINGKPTLSAELMLALIYRDHGDNAIIFAETNAERCTVEYRRRQWPRSQMFSFTVEDAKRAGLMGSQTWIKYTPALLRARCISAVARLAFADTIGGMYTPEEMNVPVTVDPESGAVTVVDVPVEQQIEEGHYTEAPAQQPVQVPTVATAQPARNNLSRGRETATALMAGLGMTGADATTLTKAKNGGRGLEQLDVPDLQAYCAWLRTLNGDQDAAFDFIQSADAWSDQEGA